MATDNRQNIGESLKQYREGLGVSLYKVAKDGGILLQNAKAVEDGTTNYTIDTLLGYVRGCNLTLRFIPRKTD